MGPISHLKVATQTALRELSHTTAQRQLCSMIAGPLAARDCVQCVAARSWTAALVRPRCIRSVSPDLLTFSIRDKKLSQTRHRPNIKHKPLAEATCLSTDRKICRDVLIGGLESA